MIQCQRDLRFLFTAAQAAVAVERLKRFPLSKGMAAFCAMLSRIPSLACGAALLQIRRTPANRTIARLGQILISVALIPRSFGLLSDIRISDLILARPRNNPITVRLVVGASASAIALFTAPLKSIGALLVATKLVDLLGFVALWAVLLRYTLHVSLPKRLAAPRVLLAPRGFVMPYSTIFSSLVQWLITSLSPRQIVVGGTHYQ